MAKSIVLNGVRYSIREVPATQRVTTPNSYDKLVKIDLPVAEDKKTCAP